MWAAGPPRAASAWCRVPLSLRGFAQMAPLPGILEARQYTLHPGGIQAWVELTNSASELRRQLLPLLGMFMCETGGTLNKVTHLYSYQDLEARDKNRAAAAADPRWRAYISEARQFVAKQESRILLEASSVYKAAGIGSAATCTLPATPASPGNTVHAVYEWREYKLLPGYGTVPSLYKAFESGLPEKMRADREGQLVMMARCDVGLANNVIELWRYPSAQACIRGREASRHVQAWRDTIKTIAPGVVEFHNELLRPIAASAWQ